MRLCRPRALISPFAHHSLTALTGTTAKGIEFVPISVPEPASDVLLGVGFVGLAIVVRSLVIGCSSTAVRDRLQRGRADSGSLLLGRNRSIFVANCRSLKFLQPDGWHLSLVTLDSRLAESENRNWDEILFVGVFLWPFPQAIAAPLTHVACWYENSCLPPPSSSGPGRRVLSPKTGVRLPVGVLSPPLASGVPFVANSTHGNSFGESSRLWSFRQPSPSLAAFRPFRRPPGYDLGDSARRRKSLRHRFRSPPLFRAAVTASPPRSPEANRARPPRHAIEYANSGRW